MERVQERRILNATIMKKLTDTAQTSGSVSESVRSLLSEQRPKGLSGKDIGLWHARRSKLLKAARKNPDCLNDASVLSVIDNVKPKEKPVRPVSME